MAHPAKFSPEIIEKIAEMLPRSTRTVLDPFAGEGGVFRLWDTHPALSILGIEIQPQWASCHPNIMQGNALALPWKLPFVDCIVTSPCYGNRMADHHKARDNSRRHTYKHYLQEEMHPDNAGALQWGPKYRAFHRRAWRQAAWTLKPGKYFMLNCSNHIRAGKEMRVTEWHVWTLRQMGFRLVQWSQVRTKRQKHGANAHLRVPYESIVLLQRN